MRPLAALTHTALLCLATAALAKTPKDPPPPKEERIRVANQVPFDVAACATDPIALTGVPTQNMFATALVLAQPRAIECLTPADTRGPAATTEVRVVARLSDQGAAFSVSGDNLTPSGTACVTDVLKRSITFEPLPAGAAPVELAGSLGHDANVNAALVAGINAPSDWVAAARASLPRSCSCYASYASLRPPVLTADVHLVGGKSEVTFRKAPTPEADALAQCLLPSLAALPVPKSDREFKIPLKLIHLHTADLAPAADLGPELAFQQADLGRVRLFAAAELALALRTRTAAAYDASVVDYQKAPKVNKFGPLVKQCAGLVEADGAWLAATQALLAHEARMASDTKALADKDPSWKAAADTIAESRAGTEKEVATATSTVDADKKACPRAK